MVDLGDGTGAVTARPSMRPPAAGATEPAVAAAIGPPPLGRPDLAYVLFVAPEMQAEAEDFMRGQVAACCFERGFDPAATRWSASDEPDGRVRLRAGLYRLAAAA